MLSLILPTYNRPGLLRRVLRYYEACQFPHRVLVADSSDAPAAEANRQIVEAVSRAMPVEYRRYDSALEVPMKLAEALEGIQSTYAVIGSDDDFFVPSALERGVAFLESHPDYALAHGESAYFVLESDRIVSGRCVGVGRYLQRTIDHASGSERLAAHLAQYTTTFYSVHRTEQLRRNWRRVAALPLDHLFDELLPSCLSLIEGKSQKLDELYMVRQIHSAQTARTRGSRGLGWVMGQRWSEHYARFQDLLAEELVGQDRITMEAAREVAKQAFRPYVARYVAKEVGKSRQLHDSVAIRIGARVRRVARGMPLLRWGWHLARAIRPMSRTAISLEALLRQTSRYHEGFMPIYRAVTAQNGHEVGAS
ncbi:MAG: TIGR00180 family glycosyltransferase [Candidatus Omnitrophica bacterium]|nr:TIGR00180 family glycosyltransferase [Candidatus Omnitrophota bacterium]MBI3021796.1 TIGR00180 family glycosyltransferase [Candidatus Omnitrophota bacterium]